MNILKDVNSQLTLRVPRHEDRIEKLHRYVNGLKVKQEKQKEAVDRKREQLKKVIRTAAKQLIQYIFPLSKVQPNKRYYIYLVKQKYILRLSMIVFIKAYIKLLKIHLFEIYVNIINFVYSLCSSEDSDSTTSDIVTSALADASGTSYVRGRWISEKENSLEIHHCIVEPTLPATGDYSAYSLWGNFVIIPID